LAHLFVFIVYASFMGLGFDVHDGCLNLVWAHIIFIKIFGFFYAMEMFKKCLSPCLTLHKVLTTLICHEKLKSMFQVSRFLLLKNHK
jgi:hypothetical protein